jgi:hypothetical protein
MTKNNLFVVFACVFLLIAIFVAWSISENKNKTQTIESSNDGIVYYYGAQCSHCRKVSEFMSANDIDNKIVIAKKEVLGSQNKADSEKWIADAKKCGLSENEIGVPFVAAYGKCYMGDVEVVDFLKKEAGL